MAEKDKTTVRRIKATDDTPKKAASKKTAKKQTATTKTPSVTKKTRPAKETAAKKTASASKKRRSPLHALGNYFKGAWYELKQVRWPTRSATWSMTAAVLLFTCILATLILLLDVGFNWLFEQILK